VPQEELNALIFGNISSACAREYLIVARYLC